MELLLLCILLFVFGFVVYMIIRKSIGGNTNSGGGSTSGGEGQLPTENTIQ